MELVGSMTFKEAVQDFQIGFAKKLDELSATGIIDTVRYNINMMYNNKYYVAPMHAFYTTVDAEAGAGFGISIDDNEAFSIILANAKKEGIDRILFYISDENNKPIW